MASGEYATTSQVPFGTAYEAFERAYTAGQEAVVVLLSSELSGTYQGALLARDQFLEAHPDASVHVIDSKCASTGEGLLVLAAADRAAEGMPAAQLAEWVETNRGRMNHLFTIDSFDHLVHGGRVSAASATVGSLLNIKPVMRVDDRGRLVPVKKPRGIHKALGMIADMAAERIEDPADQTIVVAHGMWPEYAEELKRLVLERVSVGGVIDARIGCVIGAHTGPGVLSVYFWGKEREPYKD
jgi:DegV family protein with EDD domain